MVKNKALLTRFGCTTYEIITGYGCRTCEMITSLIFIKRILHNHESMISLPNKSVFLFSIILNVFQTEPAIFSNIHSDWLLFSWISIILFRFLFNMICTTTNKYLILYKIYIKKTTSMQLHTLLTVSWGFDKKK